MKSQPKGVLTPCSTCSFAEWDRTASGSRHPRGAGRCTFQVPDVQLPIWAQEWDHKNGRRIMTLREVVERKFHGRWIYWRDNHRTESEACPTWQSSEAP